MNPGFLTLENLFDLLSHYAFLGILSVGLLVVLASGGIDISFVAVATVAQYVTARAIIDLGGNMFVAILIGATVGAVLGMANAAIVWGLRIPSIVATIATMNVYYGLLTHLTRGRWIYDLPTWFQDFGSCKVIRLLREDGTAHGLSVMAVMMIVVVAITAAWLRYTLLGRRVYALGGNPVAARRAGFNVPAIQLFVYGYMGMLAGVAGLVHTLDVQTVAPNALVGKEFEVFAAVVLGGASLSGGVGTVRGTVLGVTLIAILSNGLTLARVPAVWYQPIMGLIILTSVSVAAIQQHRVRRSRI